MTSIKKLQGIAHEIAHHSQSTLSWLHPHLGEACRRANVEYAEIEILDPCPYPVGLPRLKPLELALLGLQAKFLDMLGQQGFIRVSVRSVCLDFTFLSARQDDYSCSVDSKIIASNGKVFHQYIEHICGESYLLK